jgi:hypothetical protein
MTHISKGIGNLRHLHALINQCDMNRGYLTKRVKIHGDANQYSMECCSVNNKKQYVTVILSRRFRLLFPQQTEHKTSPTTQFCIALNRGENQ